MSKKTNIGEWAVPDEPLTNELNIVSGKIKRAQRVVIYGAEGVGKTTLASKFPNPLFLDVEDGTAFLDVARIRVKSYSQLTNVLSKLLTDPKDFKTIVIDTIDWVEMLMSEHICNEKHLNSIEDFGYGKGYTHLGERMQKFLSNLDGFIDKGVHVVLLAHSALMKFELPAQQGSYDRYTLDLNQKQVLPVVKEWSDMILFIDWEVLLKDKDGSKSKMAVGGREGKIYTTHSPIHEAKNRADLAPELPLDYEAIKHIFEL